MQYELCQPLSDIVNLTFEIGTYIDKFITSKVLPFYKDNGSNFGNYRPISLLSKILTQDLNIDLAMLSKGPTKFHLMQKWKK